MPFIHIIDKDRKIVAAAHINLGSKRNREAQYCIFCARDEGLRQLAGRLCDHEIAPGKTCDIPMCDYHATPIGKNVDICPTHRDKHKGLFEEVPA